MKKILKVIMLGCALIGAAGLCSCEREAHNSYAYALEANSSVKAEVPLDSAASSKLGGGFVEMTDYMRRVGMFEEEDFDNDARTIEEAMQKNDEEAMAVFNTRLRAFNKNELQDIYKRAGYLSVSGNVTYIMTRDDGKRVASEDLSFNFPDLN
ncbi:MAG: hypothetical protein K2O01_01655 [Bacteroidales bacterium]|nr:hypothetical protein [Bacteroidales bacterium]